ncbi:MAG: glycoside hydrolase family 16 protein [Amaricoccus sp.]
MTASSFEAGRLIWSDEFDGPAGSPPEPTRWLHETGGGGWGNREVQTYTADPANASLDGRSSLVIRAARRGGDVTSARLITKGRYEFEHGRIEARVQAPSGHGLWSAIWMLGSDIDAASWPACGEIDVMEVLGSEPHRVFGTVHCPGHSGKGGVSGAHISQRPLSDGFRTYAVDWGPQAITWSIDGRAYHSVSAGEIGASWVFDHPFYLLVNLAVGGSLGGPVDDGTALPAELKLDYLRVYEPRR